MVAVSKWIALFEQRLSSTGINMEVVDYQNKLDIIHTEKTTIQRRIYNISGHPQEELDKQGIIFTTKNAEFRFLTGEIGVLREKKSSNTYSRSFIGIS